jgi:hypothetical protein
MSDFLKDVPESSPDAEETQHSDHVDENLDIESQDSGADQGEGDGGDGEQKDGRTIENVYRELSRKQEKLEERLFSMLEENQRLIAESITGRNREPEKKTGNTLDEMSVTELDNFRAQVAEQNPDKLNEYDAYVQQRRVDDRVNERIKQFETKSMVEARRREANSLAVNRYPELGRRGSEFYKAVNNRLTELGQSYYDANPRAVLDAANDVAAERGISPTPRQRVRGTVAGRRGTGKPVQSQNADGPEANLPKNAQSKEDRAAIAARLRSAMPKGKDFDDKAITKRMGEYQDNLNYFLRG